MGYPVSNKKATWSLVLGILGIVCCGFFTAIPAIVVGHQAKQEIAATGQTGEGSATAGVILGWIGVALTIVWIIAWIVIFAAGDAHHIFDNTNY